MPPPTVERPIERLEQRVTTVEQLPSRVDDLGAQISQLRDEMHAEFSAVRNEMHLLRDELLGSIKAGNAEVMAQERTLYEDLKSKFMIVEEGRRSRRKPRSTE